MNVGELIGRLNHFPDDMAVVIHAPEEGFDDVDEVEEIDVKWAANKDSLFVYGRHGRADSPIPGTLCGVVCIS